MKIALIGMKGVGKTTFGKTLSEALELDFFDSDEWIEKKINMKVSEFYQSNGEEVFRSIESEVLKELCQIESGVFAFGGGAFLSENNRKLIQDFSSRICLFLSKKDLLTRWQRWSYVCAKKEDFDNYYNSRIKALEGMNMTWMNASSSDLLKLTLEILHGK
jgi:shikimate kinase